MHVVMIGDFPRKVDEIGGGVEAVVTYLARALQELPDIVLDAVTIDRWGGPARVESHGPVPVHYIPQSRLPSRLYEWDNIRRLTAVIGELRPDLVHAHIANQYAAAALRSGLPWVLTAHGILHLETALRSGLRNRFRQWATTREEFRLMRAAKNLISISPFINEVFRNDMCVDATLIDNPVDESYFSLRPDPQPGRILYVGRLIPRKDILTLLRAFAVVRRSRPDARLRLAGDGLSVIEPAGYPAELRRFIDQQGMAPAVEFLGQLNDQQLLGEYAQSSVLVVSSILETAPMVVLQAMAAAVPVVSTDAGGIRHLVEHGRSGAVVPVGDAGALATEVLRVLDDPVLASAMARRGREIAESRFRASDIARKTRDVYARTLAEARSTAAA